MFGSTKKWRNESTETRKQIKASRLEMRALNREHKVVQNTTYRQYIDTFNENERVFSCLFNVWVGSTTGFSFDRFFVTTSSHVNVTLYIVPSALKAIPIPVVSKLVCSVIVHFLPSSDWDTESVVLTRIELTGAVILDVMKQHRPLQNHSFEDV